MPTTRRPLIDPDDEAHQVAELVDNHDAPTTRVLGVFDLTGVDNPDHHARLPRRLRAPKEET